MSPTPKQQPLWTCPVCHEPQEPGAQCRNNCRQDTPQGRRKVRGPLAPPRDDDPPKKRGT